MRIRLHNKIITIIMVIIVTEQVETKKINDLLKKRKPILFKNGLQYFPNLCNWDSTYLIQNYGTEICNYSYDARPVRSRNQTNLEMYFNRYQSNSYLFSRKVFDKHNKTFINDLTFPNPFFNECNIEKYIIYSGPDKTGALPHSHGSAFNCMVYGEKKWIFFDSNTKTGKQLENYYYAKYPHTFTWMDWYNKEYENLLKLNITSEIIQQEKDIVYVPTCYNHTVFNKKQTLGLLLK